jgi:hypothetical protein
MTKIQMTKTKTNTRETREKHEIFLIGCPRRGLSNFVLRASDLFLLLASDLLFFPLLPQ